MLHGGGFHWSGCPSIQSDQTLILGSNSLRSNGKAETLTIPSSSSALPSSSPSAMGTGSERDKKRGFGTTALHKRKKENSYQLSSTGGCLESDVNLITDAYYFKMSRLSKKQTLSHFEVKSHEKFLKFIQDIYTELNVVKQMNSLLHSLINSLNQCAMKQSSNPSLLTDPNPSAECRGG